MTIISNSYTSPAVSHAFDAEREHQCRAAEERLRARGDERREHERMLQSPGGLARTDDPGRVARRLDRVSRYYSGGNPAESPAGASERQLVEAALERAPSILGDVSDSAAMLEKIINTADFVGIRYLDDGVAAARATGRVHILGDRGVLQGYGTGFLVSPTLFLTNHHVLTDVATARNSMVEFDYQDGPGGRAATPRTLPFDPDRFFVADRERDFALVAVDAAPDVLAQYGFNRLTEAQGTVIIGECVTIVQHPRGEKKQIALRENKIVDIPECFVHYSADTEPGSSGSPVFNDQWEVVALHHASVRVPHRTEYGGFLNEGVRVSRILQFLRERSLPAGQRELLDDLVGPRLPERAAAANGASDGTVTVQVPLEITVRVGDRSVVAVIAGREAAATTESTATAESTATTEAAADYSRRDGFDPVFLGVDLPMPTAIGPSADVASPELRYHHFSVVMHRARKLALCTAVNIDGSQSRQPPRERDRWILDPRLPAGEQTGEDVYRNNPLDKGHLVRRLDPAWGASAEAANQDTFHFTNAAPQHHDFNANATLWLGLEDYVLRHTDNHDLKVDVFTGPILAEDDPQYRGVALPRQFWKVVVMVKDDGNLSATGYLLSQAALLDEFLAGPESFSFGAYRTFQVPVRRIGTMANLDLSRFVAADPLETMEASGNARELVRLSDLIV